MLTDRHALVTGGASGIGLAAARRFASEGAAVTIADLNAEAGEKAAADLGGTFVRCDVTDPDGVRVAFTRARDAMGGLDIVHCNAGVTTPDSDITALTDDAYRRIVSVNVDGVVFGVREAVRLMADGGAIVCTASLAGLISYPPDPIYALTKHGVVGLVRALAPQLQERRIMIAAICPGIVDTPLVGQARDMLIDAGFPMLAPEDIAEAVFRAVTSGGSGDCWVCQPGREPLVYGFRGVPGPRTPGAEGMRPPPLRT